MNARVAQEAASATLTATSAPGPGRSPARASRRRLVAVRAAVASILLGVFAAAQWMAAIGRSSVLPNAGLAVPAEALDFGEVWLSDQFEWTLPIHNPTDEPIEITSLASSCGCVTFDRQSLSLLPGDTTAVRLTIDLTPPARLAHLPEWDFTVRIIPQFQGGFGREAGWQLQGRVRSAFAISPLGIQFAGADALVRDVSWPSNSVVVHCHAEIETLTAECDPAFARVDVRRRGEEGGEYEVEVFPASELPEGPFDFAVALHATLADGQCIPPVRLPVRGRVEADVFASPSVLQITGPLRQTFEETLTLQSHSGRPFRVERVSYYDGWTVEPAETDMALSHALHVLLRPLILGSDSQRIEFSIRFDNGEAATLSVPVRTYGLAVSDSAFSGTGP